MYQVEIAPNAVRDLNCIREPDIGRIRTHILALEAAPRPHGVKKLDGPLHRIRMSNWRILYGIDDRRKVVTVLRVLRRSERTYKN
jgi:mRNA-degrading endonuclease RelE of RelBE toxin-antitoxin system